MIVPYTPSSLSLPPYGCSLEEPKEQSKIKKASDSQTSAESRETEENYKEESDYEDEDSFVVIGGGEKNISKVDSQKISSSSQSLERIMEIASNYNLEGIDVMGEFNTRMNQRIKSNPISKNFTAILFVSSLAVGLLPTLMSGVIYLGVEGSLAKKSITKQVAEKASPIIIKKLIRSAKVLAVDGLIPTTPSQALKNYKILLLKYHPDKNHEESSVEKSKEIIEAYQTFIDLTRSGYILV